MCGREDLLLELLEKNAHVHPSLGVQDADLEMQTEKGNFPVSLASLFLLGWALPAVLTFRQKRSFKSRLCT